MELTGELKEAFNAQVTMELKAAVVYRQLSIDMDALDLPGIAGWFKAQSAEEEVHADKFITHMLDRDATPLLGAIKAQTKHVTTVLEAFEAALAHEKKVSEAIRSLYRLANSTDDIVDFQRPGGAKRVRLNWARQYYSLPAESPAGTPPAAGGATPALNTNTTTAPTPEN